MDARVGPMRFPVVEISLGFLQALEAQAFQGRSLRVTNAGFNFSLAVRILNAARHRERAVVGEQVAVEGIARGIVDVGDQHSFAQIVEDHDPVGAT